MVERFSRVKTGYKVKKIYPYNGIILHDYEVDLIKHIYLHRQIRATSFHTLLKALAGREIAPSNISNRIRRLMDSGILERNEEVITDLSSNFVRYFYKLGNVGLDFLFYLDVISYGKIRGYQNSTYTQKVPSSHNKAASVLANSIAVECIKVGLDFEFSRGINHRLLGNDSETIETEHRGAIIPDYVFESNKIVVSIELDTGHQRQSVISKKIDRYTLLAQMEEFKDFDFYVVFAVLDKSIISGIESDRAKRVHYLKANFELTEDIPGNMSLFAVNSQQAIPLVATLLDESKQYENIEKEFICEDFMELYNSRKNQSFTALDKNSVVMPIEFDAIYKYDTRGTRHYIYLLHRTEGDLKDYQKSESAIRYLSRIKEFNNTITLLYIYDNRLSAIEDVTAAPSGEITIASSYMPAPDDELEVYKHTTLLNKKIMKGLIYAEEYTET